MYSVVLRRRALRALQHELHPSVAAAVAEVLDGPLREAPSVVGKPLGHPFVGYRAIRRGEYRIIFAVDESDRRVDVVRIDHRRDIYHGSINGT